MNSCLVCDKAIDQAGIREGGSKTKAGVAIVSPQQGTRQLHEGRWYYFCGTECRSNFMRTPKRYLQANI